MTRAAPPRRPRVLVAEDEFFIAMDLAQDLEAMGVDVVAVKASLADVRAAARTVPIDVAVLDINLRGELVYPVVDELIARHVPVVFVTGYDDSAIPAKYAHVSRCLKPVALTSLPD